MKLIKETIKEYWGKRCKVYLKGCPTCEAWKQYDKLRGKKK